MHAFDKFHQPILSDSEMAKLARMVLRLFSHWKLDTASQLLLLGLRPDSRAVLNRYLTQDTLKLSQDTLDRIGWLLATHQALRSLYPRDQELCYKWVNLKNTLLENDTPLNYMITNRLIGIAKIARYLQLQLVS